MQQTAEQTDLWVRRYHPAPQARCRLLCLPHAGGAASYFFPVSRHLSPGIEVLAVQYPGRQDRRIEPCIESIDTLADHVFGIVRQFADRPLALFGHSMGATLAFEVARRFEQAGTVPVGLFASGRRAPSRHRDEKVHTLNDAGIIAEVKTLSGTDPRIIDDDELIRMALPAIRADYKAIETYRYQPGPALSCPIHALVGDADPKVSVDEVRSWQDHTTGEFDLQVLPGGHFYLDRQAPAVLSTIVRALPG